MPAPTAVFRYLLFVLPAIFLFTSGARLYDFFHQRSDIWWTPRGTLVPLAQSHDRVAVYVRNSELDDLVAAGQLRLLRDSVTSVLSPAEAVLILALGVIYWLMRERDDRLHLARRPRRAAGVREGAS
jgi:hypothetical protein